MNADMGMPNFFTGCKKRNDRCAKESAGRSALHCSLRQKGVQTAPAVSRKFKIGGIKLLPIGPGLSLPLKGTCLHITDKR